MRMTARMLVLRPLAFGSSSFRPRRLTEEHATGESCQGCNEKLAPACSPPLDSWLDGAHLPRCRPAPPRTRPRYGWRQAQRARTFAPPYGEELRRNNSGARRPVLREFLKKRKGRELSRRHTERNSAEITAARGAPFCASSSKAQRARTFAPPYGEELRRNNSGARRPVLREFLKSAGVYIRSTRTPPFVVTARTSFPPEPRSTAICRLISPCTVTGKSIRTPPFTVPVSRCAE